MVHMDVLEKTWGPFGRWEMREDGGFGEEVSSGDESTMYACWPLTVARQKEARPPGTGVLLGRLVIGVVSWDGLGGAWGRGRGFFYPDGSIIIDAIVIAVIGMQWFSMANPRNKNR